MAFSKEWNKIYSEHKQLNLWPFSDLVSFVFRYAKPNGKNFKVLELGCGSGAHIPFFEHLGVDYYGIEGSSVMTTALKKKFPHLHDKIVCADFTQGIELGRKFNLIIDRSSLTHNSTEGIKRCIRDIYQMLKPGGKFIGIDWFATDHSDYKNGITLNEDRYTKYGFKSGQFKSVGLVHFADMRHLKSLFSQFVIEELHHKCYKRKISQNIFTLCTWNFVAAKK
jgi:SAM-dependent methyltransferase